MVEGLKPDSGIYRIQKFHLDDTADRVGALYATGNGPHQPVKAILERPPFVEGQTWNVIYDEANNTHIIKWVRLDGSQDLVWSYQQREKEEPIVLGRIPKEFITTPVTGAPDVYIIRTVEKLVGVDICVDISANQNLVLRYFLPDDPIKNRPMWHFRPLPAE